MPPTEDQELFRAAESGDSARVEKLLKSGDNPVVADKYGNTPLMLACEFGHAKSVGLLLRHNALVSDRNHHGEAALIFASVGGHTLCAQQLLDARANVNEADAENHTPLIRAAQFGHDAVVRLLCRRGADVTASTSTTGDTALMLAARPGHFRAVQFLLVRGALVPLLSSRSPVRPALLYALASTQARGVRAQQQGRLSSALSLPAHHNTDNLHSSLTFVRAHSALSLFLSVWQSHSADANAQNAAGSSALQMAAEKGHGDVQLLLEGVEFEDDSDDDESAETLD